MHHVTTPSEFEALKAAHDVVVAYFTRDTCGIGEAAFPKVAGLLEGSDIPLVPIDTTALPSVAGQHMVFVVPTLVVFVYGREFDRHARHFSIGQVEASIGKARSVVEAE